MIDLVFVFGFFFFFTSFVNHGFWNLSTFFFKYLWIVVWSFHFCFLLSKRRKLFSKNLYLKPVFKTLFIHYCVSLLSFKISFQQEKYKKFVWFIFLKFSFDNMFTFTPFISMKTFYENNFWSFLVFGNIRKILNENYIWLTKKSYQETHITLVGPTIFKK